MKKNKLNIKVWKYFVFFSILILIFLWFFQVVFLKSYYKSVKTKEIKQVAKTIYKNKSSYNLSQIIDNITYDKSICVEITNRNAYPIKSSSFLSRGCLSGEVKNFRYKEIFINSNLNSTTYSIKNPRFDNQTIVYAMKLDDDSYAFINTSIDPIDSTVNILKNQLLIVSVLVLALSFVIAYFVSKRISDPIVRINKAARKMANGNYNVVFDSGEDIEEINELANTLNYTRDELSKTDELRRDLMANVSHDLKTPLTMIKAYAEMARDLNFNNKKKQKENMNVIIEEADRLALLVNDILTLSKMQSNIDSINTSEFDLIVEIKNILKRYEIFMENENYVFDFIKESDKVIVSADKKKIEQVIYNLINNAINYTGSDNKVTIKVTENNNFVKVEIIDTGSGIKDKDIPYIWDKYYKNKKRHKRNLIGTGLGLSIVKNVLELHNYDYGVISKEGVGSNFYFSIPK